MIASNEEQKNYKTNFLKKKLFVKRLMNVCFRQLLSEILQSFVFIWQQTVAVKKWHRDDKVLKSKNQLKNWGQKLTREKSCKKLESFLKQQKLGETERCFLSDLKTLNS